MTDYQWHDYLPPSPLYDPNSKVINYKFDEDYRNLQLDLVRSGILYEDNRTLYQINDQDIEWKRPKEICSYPKFIDGKPSRFDALQGALADCWLMAAIEGLTFHDELMNFVVPRNQGFELGYIGAFHFRLWRLGVWYDVIVDDRLPVYKHNGKLCYGHSEGGDIFWAALLEKACMKMSAADLVKPEYGNLDFGFPITAMQELTGGIIEYIEMAKAKINKPYLIWWFNQLYNDQAIMCCVRYVNDRPDVGINATHTYAITKVYKCSDDDPDYAGLFLVRVLNPWGHGEWKGDWSDDDYNYWRQINQNLRDKLEHVQRDDGEFFMDENGFMSIFEAVSICHLGPGQYLVAHRGGKPTFKTWQTTFFRGEWAHWVSDGGSSVQDRFRNPQYRFELHRDNNDANKDGRCTVVIELTHRSKKKGRDSCPLIAYYIYFVRDPFNYPKRLDRQFFLTFQPLNGDPDFELSEGRGYTSSIDLDPNGTYCVVPCTQFAGEESQFLLRVFSESSVHPNDRDDKISKALPVNEHVEMYKTTNEPLQKLFNYGAQGQGEIDWLQLKMVLEMSMNPKYSSFGLIYSILKFIRNTMKKIWSSKDGDIGELSFTKDECRSMIAMMDLNHTGKLNFSEFCNLWMKINFWTKVYEQYVGEKEQLLTVSQLREALTSTGYEINRRTIHSLSYIYANDEGQICLSDFIMCGITVESVVNRHLKEEEKCGNKFTLTLEEWVKNTLSI